MAFLCSMMVTSSCISTFSLPRSSSVQSFSTRPNPKEGQAVTWLKDLQHNPFYPGVLKGWFGLAVLWGQSPACGIPWGQKQHIPAQG